MKLFNIKPALVLLLAAFSVTSIAHAQMDKSKRPSPPATASGKVGDATITINYSSPSVKGRKIWGELTPYDKAWRAGANEATIFETDKAVKVEGKELAAGKYSVFMIPGEKEWTIIFNKQVGQWGIKRTGEANYDPANNALTVTVKPKAVDMTESLLYEVNNKGFALKWEKLEVPVKIK